MKTNKNRSGNCALQSIFALHAYSNDPRTLRKRRREIIILKLISHFNGNGEIIQTLSYSSPHVLREVVRNSNGRRGDVEV